MFFSENCRDGLFRLIPVLLVLAGNLIIIHILNIKILSIGKEKMFLPVLYLLILISTPESINFSGTVFASFFALISLFYTINNLKRENSIFLSGFFISLAILFEPRYLLLIVLPFIFIFPGKGVTFREFILFIVSLVLPVLAFSSVFQLTTGKLDLLVSGFAERLTSVGGSVLPENTPVGYLLMLVYTILTIWSMISVLSRINRYKILKAMTLYRFIALLIVISVIYFIYPVSLPDLASLAAIPVSVLIGEELSARESKISYRVLFFALLIIFAIKILYFFI
jgi:hypothetical protein